MLPVELHSDITLCVSAFHFYTSLSQTLTIVVSKTTVRGLLMVAAKKEKVQGGVTPIHPVLTPETGVKRKVKRSTIKIRTVKGSRPKSGGQNF